MSTLHQEVHFVSKICDHLAANGWLGLPAAFVRCAPWEGKLMV